MGSYREEEDDLEPDSRRDSDDWLLDTGISCSYTGEVIEYTDGVTVLLVVRPYIIEGRLTFYDMMTPDKDDYLYEPVPFVQASWDEIREKFENSVEARTPVPSQNAVVYCTFCKSGVLQGEVMGVATAGEIQRSSRNPDLGAYGNHFENLDRNPDIICIACLRDMNLEVHEFWEDGVTNNDECPDGTYMRCWRGGCPGNCVQKRE